MCSGGEVTLAHNRRCGGHRHLENDNNVPYSLVLALQQHHMHKHLSTSSEIPRSHLNYEFFVLS